MLRHKHIAFLVNVCGSHQEIFRL